MSNRPLLLLAALPVLGLAAPAFAQGFSGGSAFGPTNANQTGAIPNGPFNTNMPSLPGGPTAGPGAGQMTTMGVPASAMGAPGGHPAVVNRGFGPFGRVGMQSRPASAGNPNAGNPAANPASPAAGLNPRNSWAFRRAR